MAGTKTNYFNVLKLRACAKSARLHCKQAKKSSDDIYIFWWVPDRCFGRCYELFTDEVRSPKVTTEITLRFQLHR